MLQTTIETVTDHSDHHALLKKDPMKVWLEMKQNGFLTPSIAQLPTPKKLPKKRENDTPNRKRALAKMQQVNSFTKIFAPTGGLLKEHNSEIIPSNRAMPMQKKRGKKCRIDLLEDNIKLEKVQEVDGFIKIVVPTCGLLKEHNPEIMPSNGAISMPILQQCSKKCRIDLPNEDMKVEKVQEIDRFTKTAAPSGLLNKLNPGIINRMRSSEQVFSVINALVRRDKKEIFSVHKAKAECRGKRFVENDGNECSNSLSSRGQVEIFSRTEHKGEDSNLRISMIKVENEDVKDEVKTSLTSSMKSESVSSSVSNEKSANTATVSSLSQEDTTVASQWLQFLHQDVKSRLAALKRSQMKVQNLIQTELPSLMAKEFSLNQENEQFTAIGCPISVIMEMHQAKWNSLFHQMDKALKAEANQLEHWLNQVIEMQLHTNDGFHFLDSCTRHFLKQ